MFFSCIAHQWMYHWRTYFTLVADGTDSFEYMTRSCHMPGAEPCHEGNLLVTTNSTTMLALLFTALGLCWELNPESDVSPCCGRCCPGLACW